MEKEIMNEERKAPSGVEMSTSRRRGVAGQIVNILYLLFNGACLSVYGYQVYLWLTQSAWKKIPSRLLLFPGSEHPFASHTGLTWRIFEWVLDVELAYTLCTIAMIFYGLRWLADRRAQ
ncbi:hypothetical protein [Syntrophus gentianae]|uniref:hypothetical protein n=1 Tax=Syntrophus gentianae TaxID=43775 RepID=UPI000B86181A|nr:hypothetical protein [Syntrophus gentianae]